MSTSIQYLSGIGFLAFAEQLPLLQEELSVRFKIDVTTQHSKLYGNMLFLPDCTARVIPYWAQCTLQEPFLLHFDSIGEAATALKHIQRNWAPYQFQLFRRAALLQEKLPYLNLKERQFFKNGQCSIDIPHSAMGLYTLLDEHTLLASAKTSSCLPTGIVRLAQDHVNPPSRAYLKLQEALVLARHFFGVELPANGMRCFDAGACPGGWTWVLTELGATVLAVDRAELAPQLMEHPRVTFRMHDAFTLKPQDVGAFDWVCSDVICYPQRLLEWVQVWLQSGLVKNMICTIKMQGAVDYALVQQFADIPHSRVVHLAANKHELTWIHCNAEGAALNA